MAFSTIPGAIITNPGLALWRWVRNSHWESEIIEWSLEIIMTNRSIITDRYRSTRYFRDRLNELFYIQNQVHLLKKYWINGQCFCVRSTTFSRNQQLTSERKHFSNFRSFDHQSAYLKFSSFAIHFHGARCYFRIFPPNLFQILYFHLTIIELFEGNKIKIDEWRCKSISIQILKNQISSNC